jgi:outer membrane protein assembly factor BamD
MGKEKRAVIRRTVPPSLVAAVFVVAAASVLSGCAGSGSAVKEKTSQQWYDEGSQLAQKKKYDEALEAYREAAKGYRGADLDSDIQIGLADTYFNQESYPSAVEAYTEFLRLHPHNARADYAQYRLGLSWLKQLPRSAERSPEAAIKAVGAFEALLRGYPRSGLLDAGREGLAAARRRVAEHELSVADYYRRCGKFAAAAGRYELVLRDYADLGFADRVLYELGCCYQGLSDPGKADRMFEQLRREHPQSKFLKELDTTKS